MPITTRFSAPIGLDGDAFEAALQNPVYEQTVLDDIAQAQEYGLNGVPALIFDGKYLVSGAQPYETLVKVIEQIQTQP
jgi:predicted DsbA family dithiol-disulfide isomerase